MGENTQLIRALTVTPCLPACHSIVNRECRRGTSASMSLPACHRCSLTHSRRGRNRSTTGWVCIEERKSQERDSPETKYHYTARSYARFFKANGADKAPEYLAAIATGMVVVAEIEPPPPSGSLSLALSLSFRFSLSRAGWIHLRHHSHVRGRDCI
ncbi:uncharacterized protein LOC116197426 [Punica granatum]|uniref:Uncharacterized protein LOC116197426 n=1 Tax=Punica granatum TaxID=22663 RepID=A0A6P8CQ30_PUNGR|nr:uncharacterized protein LOC116197426 [Punica granatum]